MPRIQTGRIAIAKLILFPLCLLPLAMLIWGATENDLGANPVEALTHGTGDWALRFLLITLMLTPLRRLTGWGWPIRFRRMLGLFTFFYAFSHFVVYVWIDQSFLWNEIVADIFKRPYITVGFIGLLILTVLAATSPKRVVRYLGKRWQMIHRFVYLAALLAVVHFLWLVKADYTEPGIYLGVLLLLMLLRLRNLRSIW